MPQAVGEPLAMLEQPDREVVFLDKQRRVGLNHRNSYLFAALFRISSANRGFAPGPHGGLRRLHGALRLPLRHDAAGLPPCAASASAPGSASLLA